MIGVVVWSSGPREKAIIWCEDQSTLAYLQGRANVADPLKWPQAGDLVELETRTMGDLRHALNVTMLSERAALHLPQILARFEPEQRGPQLRVVAQQIGSQQGGSQQIRPQQDRPETVMGTAGAVPAGDVAAEGAVAQLPGRSDPDYPQARSRALSGG